jgi:hypothetical protein
MCKGWKQTLVLVNSYEKKGTSLSNSISLLMMTRANFLVDVPVVSMYIYFQGEGSHVGS